MGVQIDRTGQQFYRLTFIKPTANRNSSGQILWELLCSCGSVIYCSANAVVTNGKNPTKSCGCLQQENRIKGAKQYSQIKRKWTPLISSARLVWRNYKDGCDFETFFKLSQQNCYYCGIAPYRTWNVGKKKSMKFVSDEQYEQGNFTYNGLDRLDSSKDHSPDNVVPCCYGCNRMKWDTPVDDFLLAVEKIYLHYIQKK